MKENMKGFTLIELMIVVAIIGILAAVAIPNFKTYQLKAKETEAKVNLSALAVAQESHFTEYDVYVACGDNPGKNAVSKIKTSWVTSGAPAVGWTTIGYRPKDNEVYFSYGVATRGTDLSGYQADAWGALAAVAGSPSNNWQVTSNTATRKVSTAGLY